MSFNQIDFFIINLSQTFTIAMNKGCFTPFYIEIFLKHSKGIVNFFSREYEVFREKSYCLNDLAMNNKGCSRKYSGIGPWNTTAFPTSESSRVEGIYPEIMTIIFNLSISKIQQVAEQRGLVLSNSSSRIEI